MLPLSPNALAGRHAVALRWGLGLGSLFALASIVLLLAMPIDSGVYFSTAAAFLTLLTLTYTGIVVTCPHCHLRLVFYSMRTNAASNWLPWLLTTEKCPRCGYRVGSGA
jgi:DNA-directed RNA polymerase subunit RPC12/RpoP